MKPISTTVLTLMVLLGWTTPAMADDFSAFNIDVGERDMSGSAVSPDGKTVYVVNNTLPITVIDATQDVVTGTIDVSGVPSGIRSGAVVVGGRLYVVASFNVIIIDTVTETVIGTIPQEVSGGFSFGRATKSPSEDRVYTIYASSNDLLAIDTTTSTLVGSVNVGTLTTGVGVSPSGTRVYVSSKLGELTVVDAQNMAIVDVKYFVAPDDISSHHTALAVGHDGIVYVGYVDTNNDFNVARLDADGNLLDTLETPDWSTGLEISVDGQYLIAGNGNIIDVHTMTVIEDVDTGIGSYQVNVSPTGGRAYVTNYNSTFVTVIEGFDSVPVPSSSPGAIILCIGLVLAAMYTKLCSVPRR